MRAFDYHQVADSEQAIEQAVRRRQAKYLGGGTNLVDLMRETVERPQTLIDVTRLSRDIDETAEGGLIIGAAATNAALAGDARIRSRYPLLSRAILSGASAQIRNMATVGGNLLQRTRCAYFYDVATRCNKREPGAGCDALEGFHRYHAILGTSSSCIATHPSDMAVALAALDARIHLRGPEGERQLAVTELHREPGERSDLEAELQPEELIVAVELPPLPMAVRSEYRKVRDRASYAFALVSVASMVELDGETIQNVRLALGGVGTRPWRAWRAEAALRGQPATEATFAAAVDAELAAARPLPGNAFKVELARRLMIAALSQRLSDARNGGDA
ncbi:xanthine dehydrogenase family protein subunit M [Salinicola corii]|uniref:Xanthine dehydrogenase family protein subunit M n=1 Tax=Salinicola corii TaxID=2606937 RepID=A0A640WE66_9GAMM|nr:xanthine dehydrogenase family protein subunit M [Salinicola corii]KAA0018239.1 xanthine dehydrogenase family protein subunit M [Salinicola corii]